MKKALVVDDLSLHRNVIKGALVSVGFTVDTAADGMEGLQKLRSSAYDVVFSDIEMPNMNGFEFIARIRRQARLKRLPVIMLSTRKDQTTIQRMQQLGANGYLTKPYSLDNIRKALKLIQH